MIFIINWLVASFLNGAFFFGLFVLLLYWFYLKDLPVQKPPVKPQFEDYSLANSLQEMIEKEANKSESSDATSVLAMNMVFQFLFQELKDTKIVRRYIVRKMAAEFKELLTTKAAGKIIHKITARDFSLGTSFPVIHSLKLESHQMDKARKSIQEITLVMDIEYTNGFSISVDADLILGRSAYVHIKIASVKGKARLQFTRHPFTHWNFAFVDDPEIVFAASSHFDGRQIPQLTTLILNQLRRSIRRKHTLPNYKVRFKPFFDPIYTQSLYKSHLDEMLRKEAEEEAKLEENQSAQAAENASETASKSEPEEAGESKTSAEVVGSSASETKSAVFRNAKLASLGLKSSAKYNSIQYRRLCDKLGFDLTSVGQLTVRLKYCDRLPEALLSIVFPQFQASPAAQGVDQQLQQQQSQQPLASSPVQAEGLIYFTVSVDSESMKALMEKKICKEQWELYDFEFNRTSVNQALGLVYQEMYFVNRNEVFIQKILPNSLASSVPHLKCFDLVHSVNNVGISSIKQLNKIIAKAPLTTPLKFVVKRPCVNKEIVDNNANEALNMLPLLKKSASTQSDMAASLASTSSPAAPSLQSVPSSASLNAQAPQTSSLVSNTRQRFGRLEQKIKLSFGAGGGAAAPNLGASPTPTSETPDPRNSVLEAASGTNSAPTAPALPPPPSVVVTHTASANWLVDFFCSASECATSESLTELDLIGLLTDSRENRVGQQNSKRSYFKKTREIKLAKENLLKFNNVPVQIDESYLFDLNEQTKYLNVFLWTVQYTAKMSKMKNLLLGYVTMPLHEVNVDCWNTTKGETQSVVYFQPVDELKASASAISRLIRSNVLSDHPGFNSNVAVGALTLNLHHKVPDEPAAESTSLDVPKTAAALKASTSLDSLTVETKAEPVPESVSSNELSRVSDKWLSGVVAQDLVEQKDLELAYNKQLLESNAPVGAGPGNGAGASSGPGGQSGNDLNHKFVNCQFNESVSCEFCLKKIWFKNAYKCAYCGYTIHIKCLDKTIGKSRCDHLAKNRESGAGASRLSNPVKANAELDDSYLVIATPSPIERPTTPTQQMAGDSSSTTATPRNLVTNFLSGIRQRRWTGQTSSNPASAASTPAADAKSMSGVSTSSKAQSIISNSLSLISKAKNASSASVSSMGDESAKSSSSRIGGSHSPAVSHKSLGNFSGGTSGADNGDGNSSSDLDEFKDVDPSEEKFFGSELYDELPIEERKVKYQETIQKYQTTIEMMTRLKMDLEKDLEAKKDDTGSSRNSAMNQEKLRAQIKHLDDQMRCVVFLLMQCQIGLESCNEPATMIICNPNTAPASQQPSPPDQEEDEGDEQQRNTLVPPARPPPPSIFILNENDNSDEDEVSESNSRLNSQVPSATEAEQTDTSDDALR